MSNHKALKNTSLLLFFFINSLCFVTFSQTKKLELHIETKEEPSGSILELIKSPLTFATFEALEAHIEEVITTLQTQGYLNSRITSMNEESQTDEIVKVTTTIYIGKKTNKITLLYNPLDISKKELLKLSKEISDSTFTIPIDKLKNSLEKLQQIKTESGDPFAAVQIINVKKDKDSILGRLSITSSKKRTIDSIIIKGYKNIPRSYVTYFAGLKKGETFSEQKINSKNEILDALPFLKSIKPPEVLFKKDTTQVYLYIEKQSSNTFDGILGFNTNEETNNLEFNGYLDLKLNNNLNFGEQLLIYYKADGRDQLNFEVAATLPYLFKSPVGAETSLKLFKRDSTFITSTLSASLNYQATPNLTGLLGYENNTSNNLRNEEINQDVTDYTSQFATGGIRFLKTQASDLFPIKANFDLQLGLGRRKIGNQFENQFKIRNKNSYQFNFNDNNKLFILNETGFLSSDDYLENELYRFGGITSIRGFNENSIDANFYSILATEYRYLFTPNLYINSIIDVGYFENRLTPIKSNLYTAGLGLGFLTKGGLLKFAIANGTAKENTFSFQNTKIHISIVSNF